MNVIYANFGTANRIVPIKLGWNATTMLGHPYPFRLRPNRSTTLAECFSIRLFCNRRFGIDGLDDWRMFFEHDAMLGFRHPDHRDIFVKDFNVS